MLELLRRYHPAVVAVKYGATAWLTDELARWFVPGDRLSAVFVALICCQPSLVAGVKRGWEQLLASLVGVAAAIALLAVLPHTSFSLGASVALTFAIGSALRWPFPTLVVALFSTIYMSLFMQPTLQGTATLRCESVAMGVLAALVANLIFSPLTRRANLDVRVHASIDLVQARLAELHLAVVAGDAPGVRSHLRDFEPAFQDLRGVQGELGDLQAESRLLPRPAKQGYARSREAEAAVTTLEQVLHHGLDVGEASARLLEDPPQDGPELVRLAAASLAEALAVLHRISRGELAPARAAALTELARVRELDRAVEPPSALEERLGPRLIVLVGLAELHHHLGRLVDTMGRLAAEGATFP